MWISLDLRNMQGNLVDGFNGKATGRIHHKMEQGGINSQNSKQLAFEESLKRWRAEQDAIESLQKLIRDGFLYYKWKPSSWREPMAPDARDHSFDRPSQVQHGNNGESEEEVVAADDARCSEIGVSMLQQGRHVVDVAVPTATCLGVVHQMSSGIEGGGFMVVRTAEEPSSEAFA